MLSITLRQESHIVGYRADKGSSYAYNDLAKEMGLGKSYVQNLCLMDNQNNRVATQ